MIVDRFHVLRSLLRQDEDETDSCGGGEVIDTQDHDRQSFGDRYQLMLRFDGDRVALDHRAARDILADFSSRVVGADAVPADICRHYRGFLRSLFNRVVDRFRLRAG